MKYTEMRSYGFNIILKKYCGFPLLLPLPCHVEHGWTPFMHPLKSDLTIAQDKKLMLVFSKRRAESWKKSSNTPVEIMGAPFIHYRKINNVRQDSRASGTVAFPSHSTLTLASKFDIYKYCDKLKELPSDFKPVSVCLHYNEVKSGQADIYKNKGFQVVTAGYRLGNSLIFVKNFYNILRQFKYTTSNEIGSHTLYAVEMGLPFFLWGEMPVAINSKGEDPNNPPEIKMTDFYYGNLGMQLFSTGPTKTINEAQKAFIIAESGTYDCLKPQQLNKLLWRVFKKEKYLIKATPLHIISLALNKLGLEPLIENIIINWRKINTKS